MSDPINPSTVQLIDIDFFLDESGTVARQKLLDAGFKPRVIDTCVSGKPYGRYKGYEQDNHPLLFDYEYRYDIAILQHIENIRVWLAETELPADEWLSHGYALAWMHHHSAGPDRVKETISLIQTEKATKPRTRNPLADEIIELFRANHEPPANKDIKRFGGFIGKSRVFDDLNIVVTEVRNANKKILYRFKIPGSDQYYETVTRDGIRKKLKALADTDNQ